MSRSESTMLRLGALMAALLATGTHALFYAVVGLR